MIEIVKRMKSSTAIFELQSRVLGLLVIILLASGLHAGP
jgi:hypothetical protein